MRKMAIAMGLALLAIPTGMALAHAPARKSPVKKAAVPSDWTRVVHRTGWNGFVMGNPAAPAKLVEYGSLTCSHCAAFERDAMAPLLEQVRSGKVSYEFRQWQREPLDIAAGLVARCAGPDGYFRAQAAVFADQPRAVRAYNAIPDAVRQRFEAAGEVQQMKSIAELTGLRTLGLGLGIAAPKLDACIADQKEMETLRSMRRTGDLFGVEGTPTFFLNGTEVVPTQMDRWPDIARAIAVTLAG